MGLPTEKQGKPPKFVKELRPREPLKGRGEVSTCFQRKQLFTTFYSLASGGGNKERGRDYNVFSFLISSKEKQLQRKS